MGNIIKRAESSLALIIPVMIIFIIASINTAFAADEADCGCNKTVRSVQMGPAKQIVDISTPQIKKADLYDFMVNAAGRIWIMLSPKVAYAETTLETCKGFCDHWVNNKCTDWQDNASQYCRDTYSPNSK